MLRGLIKMIRYNTRVPILTRELSNCKSILDVGCGESSIVLELGLGSKSTAIDIYKPYVDRHNSHNDYKECICTDIMSYYPDKLFDVAVMADVLEHLTKQQGYNAIFHIQSLAKKVIIVTPNKYLINEPDDDNQYQRHLSGWSVKELKDLGFTVRGFDGLKWLRGEKSRFKYGVIGKYVCTLSECISYYFPDLSHHLYAVKINRNLF